MIDRAEIDKVLDKIAEVDPDHEDEELDAMADALRFAAGYSEETADQFISMYVSDE